MQIDTNQFNSILYFYSTIAQSVAALIALFSVFAVFRIQYSNIQKENALKILRNYIKKKCFDAPLQKYSYVDQDVDCWLDKDVPAHLREIIWSEYNKILHLGFVDYYLFVNSIEDFTQKLTNLLIHRMIILGLFFGGMVAAIQTLSYGWVFWNEPLVILFTFILLGAEFWLVIDYARISIKGPDFILLNNNETNKLNRADFSKEEIEKIIKELMKNKKLDKKIIDDFKAKV
jgi:hypothetical protein